MNWKWWVAPGPNNSVGILWINLAKSGSTDPLPYGLRLTNWNIARAGPS